MKRTAGYTFVEMVMVVVILGVLALAMVPLLSSNESAAVHYAAAEVAAALRFARSESVRTGTPHGVQVNRVTGEVDVFEADLTGPGTAVGPWALHPVEKKPFRFVISELPGATRVAVENLQPIFQFEGLARQDVVVFAARGDGFFQSAGLRHALQGSVVTLALGVHSQDVTVTSIGRVALP